MQWCIKAPETKLIALCPSQVIKQRQENSVTINQNNNSHIIKNILSEYINIFKDPVQTQIKTQKTRILI